MKRAALAALNPTFIAVEPPELIGGDISVTTADPAIVSDTVAAVKAVNPNVRGGQNTTTCCVALV